MGALTTLLRRKLRFKNCTRNTAMDSQEETITVEKTRHYNGHEVTITVEVETCPDWVEMEFGAEPVGSDELAGVVDAAVDGAVGTDYVSWDENHPVPTRDNRVI
jgi:hypothetical protein